MKYRSYCLMIIGALVLSGCQTKGEPKPSESCPGFSDAGSTRALVARKVRFINDPDVKVVEMRCVMQNDLMRVDIDLKNGESDEQTIAYRFEWLETNGMTTGGEEAWKPLLLYANDFRTIRTVSPNPDARDFSLLIKRQ
jgi:uncharacterized protein YcfL